MQQPRLIAVLLVTLLSPLVSSGQTLLQKAGAAYQEAQRQEIVLKEKAPSDRGRSEYLRVIRLYERVYLTTPHTGYADDALVNIAALYDEIQDPRDAVKTLRFLIREYPASRFIGTAEDEIRRLTEPPKPLEPATPTPKPVRVPEPAPPDVTAWVYVDNVRYWESQKSVRVVIDLDGEPSFRQGDVQDPPRVFVDIDNARVRNSLQARALPVESVMLENIRVAQHDVDTVRIVLDMVQLKNVTTFTLRDPDRLVIDVLGDAPARPATTGDDNALPAAPPPDHETVARNRSGTDRLPETAASNAARDDTPVATPALPTGTGEHSLIRSLGLKVARVVIDAGHGGKDTGTVGPTGLTEKDLVLDVAHRLKALITEQLGAEVVLTREDDTFVPLETRTAIANQAEADLFLSIHANASDTTSIRGFETFFLNFTTSREGLDLAARENAASRLAISELQDIVRRIVLRDKIDESREFASHIQKSMASNADLGRDRGVKEAPFVVLIGANMPSILSEISFISNPDDERLLRGDDRRQQIADALFDGVRSYAQTLSGIRTARAQD